MSDRQPKSFDEAWNDLGKAILDSAFGRFLYWTLERILDAQHWIEKKFRWSKAEETTPERQGQP